MARRGVSVWMLALFCLSTTAASICDEECMSNRFAVFEKRLSDHEADIVNLQRTVASQQSTIDSQDRLIQQLRQELNEERRSSKKHPLLLKESKEVVQKLSVQEPSMETESEEKKLQDGTLNKTEDRKTRENHLSTRQERTGIAFSAYLDHNIDTSNHQTIKFNKIISNEGNGYSYHTGVFTCPEAGMYLLIFNIGQRGGTGVSEVRGELIVNSVNIIDAAVDSFHSTQDLQGGNAVAMRLKAGDVVWVQTGSGHVQGSGGGNRITSFTGVFLY